MRGLRRLGQFRELGLVNLAPLWLLQLGDLVRNWLHEDQIFLLRARMRSALFGRGDGHILAKNGWREERLEAIKVGLRDRLKLVVMATSAADRQAEKDEPRGVGHIVERVLSALKLIGGVGHIGPQQIEPGGDARRRVLRKQLVAGHLLLEKTIVWLIACERLHDIIAIAPRIWPRFVVFVAVAFGKAREIEPVPPPAFAV